MSRIRTVDTMPSRITDLAIANRGMVLRLVAATGHVTLCGADQQVYGIAYTDTKVPVTAADGSVTYTATASLPVAVQEDGEAMVQLLATNVIIAIGDTLQSTAAGTADLITYAGATPTVVELASIIGTALENKAANDGGLIRVKLRINGA